MDINGEEKTIILDEKDYTAEELLLAVNAKLKEQDIGIIASYYERRLKLSFNEVGANTIDGIRGNAKGTLFFNVEKRATDNPEYYQVGPNSGETLVFDKSRISAELMRINTITIHKTDFAEKALERLDNAIGYISAERGRIGATQNRLKSIIRNNQNYEENLIAVESRIRDLDTAKEIMEKIKQNILQQTSNVIMAQASQQPQSVLELLKR